MESAKQRTTSSVDGAADGAYFTDAADQDRQKIETLLSNLQETRKKIKTQVPALLLEDEKKAEIAKSYTKQEREAAATKLHVDLTALKTELAQKPPAAQLQVKCHEAMKSVYELRGFIQDAWKAIESKPIDDSQVSEFTKLKATDKEPWLFVQFMKKMNFEMDKSISLPNVLQSYDLLLQIQQKIETYAQVSYSSVTALKQLPGAAAGVLVAKTALPSTTTDTPAPKAVPASIPKPQNATADDDFVVVDSPSPRAS